MTDVDNVERPEFVSLNDMFKAYCSLDEISRSKNQELLPFSLIEKWFIQAEILDMQNVTSTDIGLCFFHFRKRAIGYDEFHEFIKHLANFKKIRVGTIKKKLQTCALPDN